jgi:serine carboxypeptidase-like clade 2
VVWFQGGPGCSSLLAFFTEHGPFTVNDNGLTLSPNPYSWNKYANMLYVEAPSGVGFSYSDTTSDYTTGDNKTMLDNYHFLLKWFSAFPEYSDKTRKFYISGESYGGHYVPQLAWTIHNLGGIRLTGILVGNAWTDDVLDSISVPIFIYSHALCSYETWLDVEKYCNISGGYNSKIYQAKPFHESQRRFIRGKTDACDNAVKMMMHEVGNNTNQYDIYAPCIGNTGLDCTNFTKEMNYLNNATVRQAIHAKVDLPSWTVCTNNIRYIESWSSVVPIYQYLYRYKILIFAGDVTYNVPFQGSQFWINALKLDIKTRWKAWNVDGQVAGYLEEYDQLKFVTVKNSGHMVPTYTPRNALIMFQNYLKGIF